MTTPHKLYHACAMWHQQSGSRPYYITDMQHKAASMGAPLDALYLQHDAANKPTKWICVSDLSPDHPFRLAWEALPK